MIAVIGVPTIRLLMRHVRFDMMGKRLYKVYKDITNIVVRISDGTPASKEHAVLVNAHLDSTLPSPGAADDALSVGVMLECMRVLVGTPGWSPTWSIIFCELECLLLFVSCILIVVCKVFNHAEESLQDGSHLYSTQHETRHTSVFKTFIFSTTI
jgi:Zn-dependent M28 family amino/carboxypeptidase